MNSISFILPLTLMLFSFSAFSKESGGGKDDKNEIPIIENSVGYLYYLKEYKNLQTNRFALFQFHGIKYGGFFLSYGENQNLLDGESESITELGINSAGTKNIITSGYSFRLNMGWYNYSNENNSELNASSTLGEFSAGIGIGASLSILDLSVQYLGGLSMPFSESSNYSMHPNIFHTGGFLISVQWTEGGKK